MSGTTTKQKCRCWSAAETQLTERTMSGSWNAYHNKKSRCAGFNILTGDDVTVIPDSMEAICLLSILQQHKYQQSIKCSTSQWASCSPWTWWRLSVSMMMHYMQRLSRSHENSLTSFRTPSSGLEYSTPSAQTLLSTTGRHLIVRPASSPVW